MKTTELINALSLDASAARVGLNHAFLIAIILGVLLAGGLFALAWGPRPDFGAAVETPRFVFKFVYTLVLAGTAAWAALRISRPVGSFRSALLWLAAAPVLLIAALVLELMVVPGELWMRRLAGTNAVLCMVSIPLLSGLPLAAILWAMRRGAPASPTRAGAVAGLVAGGVGATFYAAHCPDDSPLFVAVWYSIGLAVITLAGAALGWRLLRW